MTAQSAATAETIWARFPHFKCQFLRRFRKFTKRLKLFGEPVDHRTRSKQMRGRRTSVSPHTGRGPVRCHDVRSLWAMQVSGTTIVVRGRASETWRALSEPLHQVVAKTVLVEDLDL